jgi:dTDP-4-amino-4,6-dideoxygalactose transaminase
MTDLQASLGSHQLLRLDDRIDKRAELWQTYDELLAELLVTAPAPPELQTRHARHLYQVPVDPGAGVDRDHVLEFLPSREIGTGVHYRAAHLHPNYRDPYDIDPAALPFATDISERTLSLPLAGDLTLDDQLDVVAALRDCFDRPT